MMRSIGFAMSGALAGAVFSSIGLRRGWSYKRILITGILVYTLVIYPVVRLLAYALTEGLQ